MATFRKRGEKWEAQVRKQGFPPICKSFSTKVLAEAWAKSIELDIERGIAGLGRKQITVKDLCERWRDEVAPTRRGARFDEIRIQRFLDGAPTHLLALECNDQRIADELRQWRDKRMTQVSNATVIRELTMISGIFGHGIKEGWLHGMPANPVSLVKRPAEAKPRTQRCTDEQLTAIVGPVPTEKPETVKQYLGYIAWLAIETAMRLGEITQLQWKNLNVQRRTLLIEDTWTAANQGGKKVKNKTEREIPLSKRAVALLQTLADHYEDADWEDKIFPVESETVGVEWRRMTKAAGLSEIHFHDLRREATTRMATKLPVETLAKVTGHTDMSILLKVYYRPDVSQFAQMLD